MNYYPLFRVRSWNNGVHCVYFYILMAAVFQTIFSIAFSWMKMCKFRVRFHLSLFLICLIDNIQTLVQIMAWRRTDDNPMMVSLLTHICVTLPQWFKCHTKKLSTKCPQTKCLPFMGIATGQVICEMIMLLNIGPRVPKMTKHLMELANDQDFIVPLQPFRATSG